MFRDWSIDLLKMIVIAVVVVVATAVSTDIFLISAIIFPILFALLILDRRPGKIESVILDVQERARVGEEITINCSVSCSVPGTLINLELLLPDQFDVTEGSNVHIFYRRNKEDTFTFNLKAVALRRGQYTIEKLKYTAHGHGGSLRKNSGTILLDCSLEVLPKVQVMKKRNVKTFSKKFVPRQSTAIIGPPSTEFDSIRNYVHGDPMKTVNWKATARLPNSSTLLVNQYEREGMSTSIILLDRGGYMRKGTMDTNPFESGIRATLTFSRLLLDRRISTGFWYAQKYSRKPVYVQPSSDIYNFQRIKRTLISGETAEAVRIPVDPGKTFFDHLKTTGANVLFLTNITEINRVAISNFTKYISRMATNVVILDILPYGIISKSHDSGVEQIYGQLILRRINRTLYENFPPNVKIFSWDPEVEKMSGILTEISHYMR